MFWYYDYPSRRTFPGTDYRVEANAGLNRVRRATWERVHVLRVGSLWDTKYCTFAPLLPRLEDFLTYQKRSAKLARFERKYRKRCQIWMGSAGRIHFLRGRDAPPQTKVMSVYQVCLF